MNTRPNSNHRHQAETARKLIVKQDPTSSITRRSFLHSMGVGAAVLGLPPVARSAEKPIQGFEKASDDPNASKGWKPVSDHKIRVGLVGYGVCKFAAEFGF